VVTAGRHARRRAARFRGGPFALHQAAAGGRLAEARVRALARGDCARPAAARGLEARSAAPLRTSGVGGSAVGHGAWVTEERCGGTRFRVLKGVLRVRDARGRRPLTLRSGQSHFARRR
jgi:hypothetical protein